MGEISQHGLVRPGVAPSLEIKLTTTTTLTPRRHNITAFYFPPPRSEVVWSMVVSVIVNIFIKMEPVRTHEALSDENSYSDCDVTGGPADDIIPAGWCS